MTRRMLALVLAVGQLVLGMSACMSIRPAGERQAEGTGGGVAVAVFADDAARRAGKVGPNGVVGELQRRAGGRWETVFRSLEPVWAVAGLPSGTYRVRFPARLDESGHVVRLSDSATTVKVKEGRISDLHATLEHVPTALVVVGVVTVIVAAVLISKYLDDHDLPEPPLPPPDVLEAIFYVTLDLTTGPAWYGVGDRLPPLVTSHFPADRAMVAARRPRVVFSLSEPLRAGELEAQGVSVLGEASGMIPGVVSYDVEHWWVIWEPSQDIPAGDRFHVTLAAEALEDLAGNEMTAPVSFSFSTAR